MNYCDRVQDAAILVDDVDDGIALLIRRMNLQDCVPMALCLNVFVLVDVRDSGNECQNGAVEAREFLLVELHLICLAKQMVRHVQDQSLSCESSLNGTKA